MAEARSLCRIDWKLGQALMPDHFLWQEDSLRREWEQRSAHQPWPMWGLVDLAWDDGLLRTTGRLLITRLELVFETGTLVDIPGNAQAVFLDLPKPGSEHVDVYVHLQSDPEVDQGEWSDREGSFVELRLQKLALATQPLRTPLPGFHLLRLEPFSEGKEHEPNQKPTGWRVDNAFAPSSIQLLALRDFGRQRFEFFNRTLELWIKRLRHSAVENALGVHKRVEASLFLRRALGMAWYLRQISPASTGRLAANASEATAPETARVSAIREHPFHFFSMVAALHMDVFAFRCGPLQTLQHEEPVAVVYNHRDLGQCFAAIEAALQAEVDRPGAGSWQWCFTADEKDPNRMVCKLPKIRQDIKLYFLVEFNRDSSEEGAGPNDIDLRLSGVKFAAPERLETVQSRALPGIALERVRLVPFPHDFDAATVQFYQLEQGPEWTFARSAGAIAYSPARSQIKRSFLFAPDSMPPERSSSERVK